MIKYIIAIIIVFTFISCASKSNIKTLTLNGEQVKVLPQKANRPEYVHPSIEMFTVFIGDSIADVASKYGFSKDILETEDGKECWSYWDGTLIIFDKNDLVESIFLLVND